MKNDHRQFLYQDGVETARLFDEGDDIPDGWTDLPDSDEWDNPPVWYVKPEKQLKIDPDRNSAFDEPEEPPSKKYPSQMNKDELIDFGTDIGLELHGMTKREMLEAINGKIKEGERDDGVSKE